MVKAFNKFWEKYKEFRLQATPRMAAYALAVERAAKALKMRGK